MVMEETHILEGVGSNPGTIHWIDICSHTFVVKIVCLVEKTKINKRKRGPF